MKGHPADPSLPHYCHSQIAVVPDGIQKAQAGGRAGRQEAEAWGQGTVWAVHQVQLTPVLSKAASQSPYCQKPQPWRLKSGLCGSCQLCPWTSGFCTCPDFLGP